MVRGAVCAGALWMSACGSAAPAPRPAETYLDRVEARLATAREETRFVLRHNPAPSCGCPPFEVRLAETWQRVQLGGEPDEPAIIALLQVTGLDADGAPPPEGERDRRSFEVEGLLGDEVALCGRGGLYVSLVPTAFVGVVPTEAAPATP